MLSLHPIISPGAQALNLVSRVLSRLARRVCADWQARFDRPGRDSWPS